ncbi:MAG: hypothetical protein FWC67_00930 [Defluviitaleaceae bacterium]|nr:hypothetical protein [Defluviitaleaceae bacterium]
MEFNGNQVRSIDYWNIGFWTGSWQTFRIRNGMMQIRHYQASTKESNEMLAAAGVTIYGDPTAI